MSDETFNSGQSTAYLYANRIKEFFPDADVILTLRNQITTIESFYFGHSRILKGVPRPYEGRHVELDDWFGHIIEHKPNSFIGDIDYYSLIKMYEKVFDNRVHILLFEDFLDNKDKFINNLCKIMNISFEEAKLLMQDKHENSSNTIKQYFYAKLRGSFFPSIRFSEFIPYGEKVQKIITKFITNSNSSVKKSKVNE